MLTTGQRDFPTAFNPISAHPRFRSSSGPNTLMSCLRWEQHSVASEHTPQHSTGAGCSITCSLPLCAACHAGRADGTQGKGTLQAAEMERAVCSWTWTVRRVWERDLSGSYCHITSRGCSQGDERGAWLLWDVMGGVGPLHARGSTQPDSALAASPAAWLPMPRRKAGMENRHFENTVRNCFTSHAVDAAVFSQ